MLFSAMTSCRKPLAHRTCVVLLTLILASCAAPRAFQKGNHLIAEGKAEAGVAKLEEASRLQPRRVEYRLHFIRQREILINQRLAEAHRLAEEGRLPDAETAYRKVLTLDTANIIARQGIAALTLDRRHRQELAATDRHMGQNTPESLATAREIIRKILSENPQQQSALNLKARLDDAKRKEQKPEAKLADAYRKPITLEFRDAPLKAVFDMISKISGLNFFFDKEVRPDIKATILAKDTPIDDAVRMLLLTNQLEQKILNENSVLIYPDTPQKQKDYQTLAVRTFYIVNAEVKALAGTLNTILKTKSVVVDERLGIIIIRDTPEVIRMAEKLIMLQDSADPEVMLDVEVLEVKRSRLKELGVRWPSQATFAPLASGTTPLTLAQLLDLDKNTITADIGSLSISGRGENASGNILANPRIRVRNKEKAKILIGDKVPVITSTSTSTGFVSDSVSYVDVGLKLEVEPKIYLDNDVAIKIDLEVSNLVREVTSSGGTLAYQIGTRGASTTLRLKDGEPQILAGLISDEDRETSSRIPGLGSLPLLGRLFGSQKDDKQRSEIVLSITPHILRSLQRPELIDAEFESGTEASVGGSGLIFNAVGNTSERNDIALETTPETEIENKAPLPVTPGVATPPVDENTIPTSIGNLPDPSTLVALTPPTAIPATPPTATAASDVPTTPLAPTSTTALMRAAPAFSWAVPTDIKTGEQFTAVLRISSNDPVQGLPMLLQFDPRLLQAISVSEGDFFLQNGGQSTFNQRIDVAKGKIFVSALRPEGPGVNGTGSIVLINFKGLTKGETAIQLLSVTPEPPSTVPTPIEQKINITP